MRNILSFAIVIGALFCLNRTSIAHNQEQTQTATPQQAPAHTPPQQPSPPIPTQQAPAHSGPVIVLNPAHGGTDAGARGGTGAIEKDIVLQYAKAVRTELERDNFRAVLTREDDSNPSYDDRAAMANTYRDVIFVSLHVASTGAAGTARVYYYRFASTPSGPAATIAAAALPNPQPAASLALWEEAQAPYVETSHRLADALQTELAQRMSGSPIVATAVPVRELRSIGAPAVAVEVSSVSVTDPNTLSAFAAPLAAAIGRGLQSFKAAVAGAN